MHFKMLEIKDLLVNILNPRYMPQDSEIKEMNLIVENGNIEKLMKDIAKHGMDPSENLLVMKTKEGKYEVEEGNRRVTALKLLNHPELAPQIITSRANFIERVNKIRAENNYKPIREIQCVIMDDEEKMRHFITLKHTGANGGAGRISWDTESQTRYSKADVFRNYLLKLVSEIVPEKTEGYNFTTIERILGDPDMREFFSIELNKKIPILRFTKEEGRRNFEFVIRGLSKGRFNVKDFHSKSDRLKFIKFFPENELKDNQEASETGNEDDEAQNLIILETPNENKGFKDTSTSEVIPDTSIAQVQTNELQNPIPTSSRGNRRQTGPKLRKYPFEGVNYKGNNPGISYSLHELHNIPEVYNYPLAATTLFRTFFECTIQEFIDKSGIQISIKNNKSIKDLSIDSLLQTCCNNGNSNLQKIKNFDSTLGRILVEANGKRDQDELNVVIHGNHRVPSKSALIDMERRWYAAIKIMIETISGQK